MTNIQVLIELCEWILEWPAERLFPSTYKRNSVQSIGNSMVQPYESTTVSIRLDDHKQLKTFAHTDDTGVRFKNRRLGGESRRGETALGWCAVPCFRLKPIPNRWKRSETELCVRLCCRLFEPWLEPSRLIRQTKWSKWKTWLSTSSWNSEILSLNFKQYTILKLVVNSDVDNLFDFSQGSFSWFLIDRMPLYTLNP
jgi:hypothetical protein